MDHSETELHDSLPSPNGSPEFVLHSPADPDPDPHNHHLPVQTVKEEKEETLHEELKEHLHLKEEVNQVEEEEEEERSSNGWNEGEEGFKSGWSDWGEEFKDVDNGKDAAWAEEGVRIVEVQEEDNDKDERSNGGGFEGGEAGVGTYPVRPGAENCSFYMKTGTCKFGFSCKFNHPVRRKNQAAKEKVKEREETAEKPGLAECKYYLRTGGCKYGNACRYNHSRPNTLAVPPKSPAFPVLEFNFLGLPIRLGEKECPYYMRNGSCKYGANCRFNHPDASVTGGRDPPAFSNGGSPPLQASSKSNVSSWSLPRALNDTPPFVPMMFSTTQGILPQNPEWHGYQASVFSPGRGVHHPPVFAINSPATKSNAYGHQQQPKSVDEFPERPGQPECSYFMKTGDCKFKSNCKYHHPKNRISKPPPCALSDKGLPLRPDQNVCAYYSRYGICKFGPACKFNHPIQPASAGYSDDPTSRYVNNSSIEEETQMAGSGNDNAIQQAV